MQRRAVFLDRDGVLNSAIVRDGKPYSPASVAEVEIVPEAERSLARLRDEGFLLIVVTNQPEVRRGTTTRSIVESINELLRSKLPVDEFFVCYHDDPDECDCRKPKPGMLLRAAAKYDIDLGRSYLVGDRWRDIEAGALAGCETVFIDYGYRDPAPKYGPDAAVFSLAQAVDWILSRGQEAE